MYKARLNKELTQLRDNVHGLRLITLGPGRDREIEIEFDGPTGSLYDGETFRIYFNFSERYPLESPIVWFQDPTPVHPHVYTNGHICLSILGSAWSPALTVEKVCLSIQSMLASAEKKALPDTNDQYVRTHPRGSNPKNTQWLYDDDKC